MIYAGSPGTTKDCLDLILNVLDYIVPKFNTQFRFDIIGITEEQYCNAWGDDKPRDYITFHGRRPHEEAIRLLLEADFQIFLRPDTLPNRAGFPTKFVETLTSGTLPITNLSSNLDQSLHDNQNGFVIASMDIQDINSAISCALCKITDQIDTIKNNIRTNTFDYREYINTFNSFMSVI